MWVSGNICYGGLNENGPFHSRELNAWSPVGEIVWLGMIRSCGLLGGDVSLGEGFEVSKAQESPVSSLSLPPTYGLGCKLSATASAPCLPACCHSPCNDGHGLTL